jgi:fatty-acyl-CoA synthase
MLVAGYHGDPSATAKATRDGFFSVGDLGRVDADGYYYLADRKHDMVISGGVNIYPLEIEERIHAHPAVLECAIIGVPDTEWGESLRAFVVRRPNAELSAADVQQWCKETLANYKCPKTVEFVDALPRTPTGKVLKRELRGR